MSHETLANYLETNFALHHHYKWDMLEDVYPWERSSYVRMLNDHVENQAEQRRQLDRQSQSSIFRGAEF